VVAVAAHLVMATALEVVAVVAQVLAVAQIMELQTLVVAAVVDVMLLVGTAALVLSLFVMSIHTQPQHLQLAHPLLQILAAIAFINGLHQVQSHFEVITNV